MAARDWCKLAHGWFRDKDVRRAARKAPNGSTVMSVFPVLVAECASELHVKDNPEGNIEVSLDLLAEWTFADESDVQGALVAMRDAKLIRCRDLGDDEYRVRVVNLGKWQSPKGTNQYRKEIKRVADKNLHVRDLQVNVTPCHAPSRFVTEEHLEGEGEVEKKTPPPKPKSRRVSGLDPDQIEASIQTHRDKLGSLAPQVDSLVALLAAGNKSNTVAASRALNKLWAPIALLVDSLSLDALAYGLSAAISNEAPNANYVEKAARGYDPSKSPAPSRPQSYEWRDPFPENDPFGEEPRLG